MPADLPPYTLPLTQVLQGFLQPPEPASSGTCMGQCLLVIHASERRDCSKVRHLQWLVQRQVQQCKPLASPASSMPVRVVCIIVHLDRQLSAAAPTAPMAAQTAAECWQAGQLPGWQQVHIDRLEGPDPRVWVLVQFGLRSCADDGDGTDAGGDVMGEEQLWEQLPLEQLMTTALLPALGALVYPPVTDAAGAFLAALSKYEV